MFYRQTTKTAVRSLLANKSRSVLTILGIVVGVASIIIIVSIGHGAKKLISNEITSLGSDIVWIEPGKQPKGPTDFAGALLSNTLKIRDIEALKNKNNVPNLLNIAPAVMVPGAVAYMGETYHPLITGWSASFFGKVFNIQPKSGVYFGESAIQSREKVAVIGLKVKNELFGESDAIGKNIRIKDKNFKVVGILPKEGQIMFFNIDDLVLIPYTTAQSQLLGIDYYNEVWVQVKDINKIDQTILNVKQTLREMHGITNPDKDDFYVLTQQNMLDQVDGILKIITALLTSIVAVSLLVGGVGVMNIMLVSVAERTREIGLRKAVGATNENIVHQFLLEAIILTIIGGLIGVLFGAVFAFAIISAFSHIAGVSITFTFPTSAAIIGIAVSGIAGLVFGIYPAKQAAKKRPIDTLRYE